MVQYQVSFLTTDEVKARMTQRTQQMRAWLDELEQASQRTLAGWEGSAQNAYYAAKREWDSGAAAAQDILTRRILTLGRIEGMYAEGDLQSTKYFPSAS